MLNVERPRLVEPGPFCGLFGAPPTSERPADVRYLRPCRTDQVLPTPDQSHGHLTRSEKASVLAVASVPSRTPPRDAPRGCGAPTWLLMWSGTPELRNSVAMYAPGALLACSSPATRSGRWVSPSPARALHDRAGRGPSNPAALPNHLTPPTAAPTPRSLGLVDRVGLTRAAPTAGSPRAGLPVGRTTAGLMARVRSGCPCGAPGRERPTPDHPEPGHAPTAGPLPIRVPRRDARDLARTERRRERWTRPDTVGTDGPAQAAPEAGGRGRDGRPRRGRPPAAGAAGGRPLGTITDNSSRGAA